MTRTPKEAEEGRLNLIVGAETSVFDTIRPLLGCFSNISPMRGLPVLADAKTIHNYVSLGYAGIMAEAAATANTYNIALERLIEVLAQGGGTSVVLDRFAPYLARVTLAGFNSACRTQQGYWLFYPVLWWV